MKIKYTDRYGNGILDVFGIYWGMETKHPGVQEFFTYFLALRKATGNFTVYASNDVEVIDAKLEGRWLYFNNGIHGVYYEPLIAEELLDDLLERTEGAFEKFLQYAKRDGLLDPDFY